MSKLTLLRTHQISPQIKQSRLKRDWMDDTYLKHAYRCLPLSQANVNGWEIILQQDLVVQWDGGQSVPRILEGEVYRGRTIANCNKVGMIDIHMGWAFSTEEGYDTWLTGPPNYFLDGAVPLTASIPSHWWPDEVQFSWKITKVGEPVVFPEGMPFAFFMVYPNSLMPSMDVEVENLWDKPDLIEQRMSYSEAKMKKNREEPWKWMNGIRTGLNEKGEQIGPKHEGGPKLQEPDIPEVPYHHE